MFTLQHPATASASATTTVVLKDPVFGNTDRTDANTLNRESRHGVMLGYRDPSWPVIRTKFFNFESLTKESVDELTAFMDLVAGYQIKITDHNDDEFLGFIITGNNEIVTTKDNCSYDVSFEFM